MVPTGEYERECYSHSLEYEVDHRIQWQSPHYLPCILFLDSLRHAKSHHCFARRSTLVCECAEEPERSSHTPERSEPSLLQSCIRPGHLLDTGSFQAVLTSSSESAIAKSPIARFGCERSMTRPLSKITCEMLRSIRQRLMASPA